jgi:hypothetical protein
MNLNIETINFSDIPLNTTVILPDSINNAFITISKCLSNLTLI